MGHMESIKEKRGLVRSEKVKVLDEAFSSFKEILNEYAETHNLTEKDYAYLCEIIDHAYQEKRMVYFLEDKLQSLNSYLKWSMSCALQTKPCKDEFYNNFMYVKHLKKIFADE